MRRLRGIWTLAAAGLLLSGCVTPSVFESLGLIVALGYDQGEEGTIEGTSVIYKLDKDVPSKATVLSNNAYTSKKLREDQNRKASKKLVLGQLRVALYEDAVAENGIINLVDSLSRDPSIGTKIFLGISRKKTADLLQYSYKDIGNIGTYLYETIKQNVREGQVISSTLHEFLRDYYSPGKDPLLPVVVREGESIVMDDIAVFRADKLAGILSSSDSSFLKLIRDRFKTGIFEFGLNSEDLSPHYKKAEKTAKQEIHAVVRLLENNPEIKLVDPDNLIYEVKLDFTYVLEEITAGIRLSEPQVIDTIEKLIVQKFQKKTEHVLKKLTELKADPIGFGEVYLQTVRGSSFTKEEWHDRFASAQFKVEVKAELLRTGVVE
ncbi:Ger(x)C family spore germination protein [Paenibacillus lutrae]|uniref:Ger(X)C family spore germination protein n=1 Tax=Paenibacillus lutrae TaxID=2078573 RepID=A0A7X3K0F7_9BACL|nr:Ger(x)C family spore germination protein [Paenibacillus lutrae]MVP01118.1 Ger(x)C family spore germination protein [Paenibacillus lutrae]